MAIHELPIRSFGGKHRSSWLILTKTRWRLQKKNACNLKKPICNPMTGDVYYGYLQLHDLNDGDPMTTTSSISENVINLISKTWCSCWDIGWKVTFQWHNSNKTYSLKNTISRIINQAVVYHSPVCVVAIRRRAYRRMVWVRHKSANFDVSYVGVFVQCSEMWTRRQ